jgi:pyridoxal phosphate enzyme (YggS family)
MTHYETVRSVIAGKAQLCVVTKKRSKAEIMAYYDLGERMFGENHAQELLDKVDLPADIRWQFIGHLQTNKVRQIVPYVDCVQSLDSLALAKELDKQSRRLGRVMKCLAEFHLAEADANKTGLARADAIPFLDACKAYPNIEVCGIMVMGPHTGDTAKIAAVFRDAHQLYLELQKHCGAAQIRILSMGMSADYPIAVAEGANLVRIGTYLFEEGD